MKRQKKQNFMGWDNPKSAIITGASSGIGAAYAHELAAQGFKIILVARRENRLKQIAKELEEKTSKTMEVLVADLTKEEDREKIVTRIAEHDDVEVLINNAGFGARGAFYKSDIEKHLRMMLVHNTAPVQFCRAALPGMVERGRGVIINISSLDALMRSSRAGIYCATKTFLNVFTESLALELQETGVKVQALCPGMTISEFHSVGDFKGYDRTRIPKMLWMSAEETVRKSLKAIRKKKIVVIPGKRNQLLLWVWNRPIIRKLLIRMSQIEKISEGNKTTGL